MNLSRRVACLIALLLTIPVGLAWRGLPLGLSPFRSVCLYHKSPDGK